MRIFKYRGFCKWLKSERLDDSSLQSAVDEIERGLYDANLGAGLYKKRVPRKGKGKSGGYRVMLAFKLGNRAVFI